MKSIPKYLFIIILFFSINVFASCKFEFIPMKSDISKFEKKITFGLNMGRTIDDINSFPIPVEEICKDKKFKMFPITYSFVNDKLHQIFFEDMLTDLDHLDNLKKIYGEPSDYYEDDLTSGIKYYHWEFVSKHVFLVIKFSPEETISNVEIVTEDFAKLIEKRNDLLEN
tara:strand:+ start:783 stop:1289 length:507 start_codon:yes stop_codon:yes gene_type:complete